MPAKAETLKVSQLVNNFILDEQISKKPVAVPNPTPQKQEDLLSFAKPLFNEDYFNQKLTASISKSKL